MSRNSAKRFIFLLIVGVGANASLVTADDSDCVPPRQDHAAEGLWHGSFWVEYEPSFEHVAVPITMRQRWQADLEFEVIRSSKSAEDGVIHGTAEGEMKMRMSGNIRGQGFNQTAQSSGHSQFVIEAKELSPDWQFKKLELKRAPGPIGFSTNQTITGPNSKVTTAASAQNGTYDKAHTHAELNGKVIDKDTNFAATRVDAGPGSQNKVIWFELAVEQRSCATMLGKINREAFEAGIRAAGVSGHVVDSNWAATFDDRDLNFERQVDEVLGQRFPNPPKVEFLKRVMDQYLELRGSAERASDYRLCVLQPLLLKAVGLNISLMRQEAQRVSQMKITKLEQMSPSLMTVMQSSRFLQLLGVTCKLASDLEELVQQKARDFIKEMVTHNPSIEDLLAINRLWALGFLDMGDATGAFVNAWNAGPGAHGAGKPGP